jgi:cell division protease FtsH
MPGMMVEGRERAYSEQTAEAIDLEVTALLRRLHDRAVRVLERNREQLELLAQALLADEVLDGDRLRELLRGTSLPPEEAERGEPSQTRVH